MKMMKRLVVLCLAAALCLALAVPALAAEKVPAANAEQFVTQLYRGLLDRDPDDAGKVTFVNSIVNNNAKAASVAEAIAGSAEFRGRQLTNEQYVQALYRGLFAREADAAGMNTFKGALDAGYSRTWVLQQLLGSLEFTRRCADLGMHVGQPSEDNKNPDMSQTVVNQDLATQYVNRLYAYLLGRSNGMQGDPAAQNWVNKLVRREMSAAGVAANIASSQEFNARSLTNGEFIQASYWALLGRDVDAEGWSTFMTHLGSGKSRSWVFSTICSSQEFKAKMGEMAAAPGTVKPGSYPIGGNTVKAAEAGAYVDRLYTNLLKRSADAYSRQHWIEVLQDREMSAAGVAASIASSAEFRSVDRNREQFVTDVYNALLDRNPDPSGMDTFTKALRKGYSRAWVFTKICASPEFQNRNEYAVMNVVPGYLNASAYNMG